MRWERLMTAIVRVRGWRRLCGRVTRRDAQGAAPVVEDVEDVGLAELDADRPASRPFCVVAIEVPIDTALGNSQRNTSDGPAADLLERRSDDANEMAVIFAAQVRLDLPAIVFYASHRTSPDITLARVIPSRTSSAPVSSMSSAT